MDATDVKIAEFARRWFAELSGDTTKYDIERLDGRDNNSHATLDAFADELCDLITDAECRWAVSGANTNR